ncbi:osmotically-inducible protein OsmY [Paraburkholderia atlantica]|uniref:Osmotically-inducible protein OsmY n=1 Tax=Paraburkholderia atlantica TaxID=2654982 RepID=A0A6I1Q0A5_PARAM|nr:BON domain-containing protein [Paraburkholderia atlantica]MBB5419438.1 osmotically-inducible protein OsmY [Paraburkholderia atlantica]MBB5421952.1 osmotically-inducible protein OsmY [Paraburkholderia atlantica]MPW07735.1 BON domain-containing protein [Paraburkholderia atlantica]NUY31837.1 BON domain-containing protein [Paraburkholderia atlantica]
MRSASSKSGESARLTDAQIATEAARRLAWDSAVPPRAVRVKVAHGRITLSGELQSEAQRTAMLEDVTRLFGVTGIADRTVIKSA